MKITNLGGKDNIIRLFLTKNNKIQLLKHFNV